MQALDASAPIVLDASAAVELLLKRVSAEAIAAELVRSGDIHVPGHFHAEVFSGLRRQYVGFGAITKDRFVQAIDDLRELPVLAHPLSDLVADAARWAEQFGAGDALYLALCGRLRGSRILTVDQRFARALRAMLVPVSVYAVERVAPQPPQA